jgi:HEAT repeat protein
MRAFRRIRTRLAVLVAVAFVAPHDRAIEALADEPPHANAAVYPLLNDLANPDPSMQISAAMSLRELGPVAWPAVPALIDALSDPHIGVRKSAAGALGGIGPVAKDAVPSLALALQDSHRFVRSWAAMALYEIGPASRAATPQLIELLRSDAENLRGRSWSASALPRIEADPAVAVPALLEALARDPSEEVRAVAVLSLEAYGAESANRGAALGLIEALSDAHWKVRGNAACALGALGIRDDRSLSALAVSLGDSTPYVRNCAERSLGELRAPISP